MTKHIQDPVDTIMNGRICKCGKPVEALVFSQEHGAGGMAFTTWTGNGKVCQACTEAQEFVRELKR